MDAAMLRLGEGAGLPPRSVAVEFASGEGASSSVRVADFVTRFPASPLADIAWVASGEAQPCVRLPDATARGVAWLAREASAPAGMPPALEASEALEALYLDDKYLGGAQGRRLSACVLRDVRPDNAMALLREACRRGEERAGDTYGDACSDLGHDLAVWICDHFLLVLQYGATDGLTDPSPAGVALRARLFEALERLAAPAGEANEPYGDRHAMRLIDEQHADRLALLWFMLREHCCSSYEPAFEQTRDGRGSHFYMLLFFSDFITKHSAQPTWLRQLGLDAGWCKAASIAFRTEMPDVSPADLAEEWKEILVGCMRECSARLLRLVFDYPPAWSPYPVENWPLIVVKHCSQAPACDFETAKLFVLRAAADEREQVFTEVVKDHAGLWLDVLVVRAVMEVSATPQKVLRHALRTCMAKQKTWTVAELAPRLRPSGALNVLKFDLGPEERGVSPCAAPAVTAGDVENIQCEHMFVLTELLRHVPADTRSELVRALNCGRGGFSRLVAPYLAADGPPSLTG